MPNFRNRWPLFAEKVDYRCIDRSRQCGDCSTACWLNGDDSFSADITRLTGCQCEDDGGNVVSLHVPDACKSSVWRHDEARDAFSRMKRKSVVN